MRENKTDVLVVGAGPTGLLTAVALAEADIDVEIIDREERTAARSYACALHSSTLELLDRLGLADTVLELGRRVHTIAFYDGEKRRAEISLSDLGGDFPFLLVLPQSQLEAVLTQRLRQKSGLAVKWNHRFDAVQCEEDAIVATVEKLEGTALGYIVPHWETMVKKRFAIRARFLVGADGHNSLVRERLGIEYERVAGSQSFVACEFSSEAEAGDEVRIVLDDGTTNVLWPLRGNEYRWTFQLIHFDPSGEFPEKERRVMPLEKTLNEQIRKRLEKLARHRAPWFSAGIKEIGWCKQVAFEHRLAKQFGLDRCWLAGDAAHQTGPVGVQSLNAGLCEAENLAEKLEKILRDEAPLSLLKAYDSERQKEWQQLLELTGGPRARSQTDSWIRARTARILPCLPASGADLRRMSDQLGFDLPLIEKVAADC
jgi:2-polyprenyl-6-methoxyphenol hydroxylase-like FAD-dependent oxidoreductase